MLIPGKNHTDYPEENNIIPCHQHIIGIKIIQILCLLRPSQGRKRPQRRGKPGIQRILILIHMGTAAFRAFPWILPCHHKFPAVSTIISRNPVPPPELPGNAPVTDIIRPVKVDLLHPLWQQRNLFLLHCLHGRLNQFIHLHKPLLLYHRLHCGAASVVGSHIMGMGHYLYQQPLLLQFLHHQLPGFIPIHPLVFPAILVHSSIIIQHINLWQVMPFPNFKVIRVMSWCNLNAACPKFLIHIVVCHNRNLPPHQRQDQSLPDNILIPPVFWVYSNGSIPQQCLRPGSGNLHKPPFFSLHRIIDMPEEPILILMLHLRIRNRRLTNRAPVHNPGSLINQPFLIKLNKHFLHRPGTALIHSKPFPVPICGRSHLLQLLDNAIFVSPLPNLFQKPFPSQILFINPLFFQGFNHLNFCGNRSMVRPRLP